GVAAPPGTGVAAGVQLDRGNAEGGGAIDGARIGVDEETDAYAGGREAPDGRADLAAGAAEREAAFGGDLPAPLGDERRLKRLEAGGDPHDLGRRAELEVEHAAHRGAERADVGVLDVATILAQMHGDAVGAAPLGRRRGAHGVGLVGAARLAHRRDVINVDVEPHAVLPSVHSAPTRGIVRETTTDRARRAGLPRVWGSRPGETRTAVASGDARAVHVRRESERPRADADAVGQ